MKILIIGQGGREHALAWKAAQSPQVNKVYVAPGNAGTAIENKTSNIDIAVNDVQTLCEFAKKEHIDLTIVGPEAALAAGVVDQFNQAGLLCFGPTKAAAQLEISKSYCKDFMKQYQIPTAKYAVFSEQSEALDYLKNHPLPVVIKADGLAAGKGVVIAETLSEARHTVEEMLGQKKFGDAGQKIVIEEFLEGEELSFIVISDGKHTQPLASSQDHKKRNNGDEGQNTGGMGAYSPAPLLTPELEKTILSQVIEPTIKALSDAGIPYVGFLYAGLMVTKNGEPRVLEFNCRLGDPETQPILMRLQSDLIDLCLTALKGKLHQTKIQWDSRPALSVVLATEAYPDQGSKGEVISGLTPSHLNSEVKIFHAGTLRQDDQVVTNGGRILTATALGDNLQKAQEKAYQLAQSVHWKTCYYRTDIGFRALGEKG